MDRDLASTYMVIGEIARKANRTADATRAFRKVVDILTRSRAANRKSPAADWLMLTVSHGRLGEMDQARAACRKAAELVTPSAAAADTGLNSLLQKAVRVVGLDRPEAAELLAAAAGEPPEGLTAAIREEPGQAKGYRERGNWYGGHGLWRKAEADLVVAERLQPDTFTSLQLGALLVHLGEMDRYREHCRLMLAHWGNTPSHEVASNTVKACMLLASSPVDADRIARLAQVAVSGENQQPSMEWYLFSNGLHAYRTEKFAEALAACQDSRRRVAKNQNEHPRPHRG